MSRNRVIGRDGQLPWHMPADLRRFKQRTMGHAIIMGRKTWDALKGVPLAGRINIVLTRDQSFSTDAAVVVHSLQEAIAAAKQASPSAEEIFVAGGAEVYRIALPIADRIDLTVIDTDVIDGDAHFPEFEHDRQWQLKSEKHCPADDRHAAAYAFRTYQRLQAETTV